MNQKKKKLGLYRKDKQYVILDNHDKLLSTLKTI